MNDEYQTVAKELEARLLVTKSNSVAIPVGEFYDITGRERMTEKFYKGVTDAAGSRHLLVAFGDNVVAVMRDVEP